MRHALLALSLALVAVPVLALQRGGALPEPPPQTTAGGPFGPFEDLLGHWRGTSEGQLGETFVEKHFTMALGGRYLQVDRRAVAKRAIYEDLGLMSLDKARETFVLRDFQSEGYVTQYKVSVQDGGKTFVLESEWIENAVEPGLRARVELKLVAEDELSETYSLAKKDEPFAVVDAVTLRRSRD